MQPNQNQSDDDLDQLLLRATWPSPSDESTQRLKQQWSQLTRRSTMKIWRPAMGIAAGIAVAVAVIWPHRNPEIAAYPTVAVKNIDPPASIISRPPTPLELSILQMMNRQKTLPRSVSAQARVVAPVARPADPTQLANRLMRETDFDKRAALSDELVALGPTRSGRVVINLLVDDNVGDCLIDALIRHPTQWPDVLFAGMNDPRVAVRTAALKALAGIDGPIVTARLIAMAKADINRREAIAALVRIDSPTARQYVAASKLNPELGGIVRSAIAQL